MRRADADPAGSEPKPDGRGLSGPRTQGPRVLFPGEAVAKVLGQRRLGQGTRDPRGAPLSDQFFDLALVESRLPQDRLGIGVQG